MKQYIPKRQKINYSNEKEFFEKFNNLNASGNMPITILPAIPDMTDSKTWTMVYYYVEE